MSGKSITVSFTGNSIYTNRMFGTPTIPVIQPRFMRHLLPDTVPPRRNRNMTYERKFPGIIDPRAIGSTDKTNGGVQVWYDFTNSATWKSTYVITGRASGWGDDGPKALHLNAYDLNKPYYYDGHSSMGNQPCMYMPDANGATYSIKRSTVTSSISYGSSYNGSIVALVWNCANWVDTHPYGGAEWILSANVGPDILFRFNTGHYNNPQPEGGVANKDVGVIDWPGPRIYLMSHRRCETSKVYVMLYEWYQPDRNGKEFRGATTYRNGQICSYYPYTSDVTASTKTTWRLGHYSYSCTQNMYWGAYILFEGKYPYSWRRRLEYELANQFSVQLGV